VVKKYTQIPDVAEAVKHLMPQATEDELKEATENFRDFLRELYDIFMTRCDTFNEDDFRDIWTRNGTVEESNEKEI
jgi:hypothetical protein